MICPRCKTKLKCIDSRPISGMLRIRVYKCFNCSYKELTEEKLPEDKEKTMDSYYFFKPKKKTIQRELLEYIADQEKIDLIALWKEVEKLPGISGAILQHRFFLNGEVKMTYSQIGKIFELSFHQIAYQCRKGLRLLRHPTRRKNYYI